MSTTPVGSPFERVAIPGLRYKGFAEVTVRRDGVSIAVTGEPAVNLERDGLSLLQWRAHEAPEHTEGSEARVLESSFRFTTSPEQQAFADAIAHILQTEQSHTTQEDA